MKPVKKSSTLIAHYALPICLLEIGPGAILHGLKLPFTGFFLSLNQLFILVFAQKQLHKSHRFASYEISTVVSLFKTLAPVGKKLTPMIAISAQGIFFNIPFIFLDSPILIAHIIGAILFSLWGVFQPLLLNYLVFGENLFHSFDYFIKKVNKKYGWIGISDLFELIAVITIFRILVAIGVCLFSYFNSEKFFDKWKSYITSRVTLKKSTQKSFFRQVIRDLGQPLFLLSLGISCLYIYFQTGNSVSVMWYLGRVICVVIALIYVLRVFKFDAIFKFLDKTRFNKLSGVARELLSYIRSE